MLRNGQGRPSLVLTRLPDCYKFRVTATNLVKGTEGPVEDIPVLGVYVHLHEEVLDDAVAPGHHRHDDGKGKLTKTQRTVA